MVQNIEVHGIILDTSLIKEYDKRLVILTSELGKITVFANGVRRKNSMLTAVSQKFVMGKFELRAGRNAYTLVSAVVSESFYELSYDLEKMSYASYICECAAYYTREGIRATDELNLMYVSFKAILNERQSLGLIKAIFQCKIMDIEGEGLRVDSCLICGEEDLLHHISPKEGGLICDKCLTGVPDLIKISDEAIYAIGYILSRNIGECYTFDLSLTVAKEIEDIMDRYMAVRIDKHFKSLDLLDSIL